MAKKTTKIEETPEETTEEVKKPLQDLVRVIKNGLCADVLRTTLAGWEKDGWKLVDVKD